MKIICDANVILDVLLDREPFAGDSGAVLALCEKREVEGFIPATCITDVFYFTRKFTGSAEDAYRAVGNLLTIFKIADVTHDLVLAAYQRRARDFEDCIVAMCALALGCGCLVTRNVKDYKNLGVPALEPSEFLRHFRASGESGFAQLS